MTRARLPAGRRARGFQSAPLPVALGLWETGLFRPAMPTSAHGAVAAWAGRGTGRPSAAIHPGVAHG